MERRRRSRKIRRRKRRGWGMFDCSQVVRVDDGEVGVLAVGGAIVWAG